MFGHGRRISLGVAALTAAVLTIGTSGVPAQAAAPPVTATAAPSPTGPGTGTVKDPYVVSGAQGQSVVPNFTSKGPKNTFVGDQHWRWTAPSTGNFSLSTYGSEVDTVMTVTPHGKPGPTLTNDNTGNITTSAVTLAATAGQAYDVTVSSKGSQTGLLTLTWSAATVAAAPATAPTTPQSPAQLGVTSSLYPTIPVSANTGEKPQNKLWYYDGTWWAVLPSATIQPAGSWVFRQEAGGWRNVLWLTGDTSVRADVVPVGDVVRILLHGAAPQLVSIQYDAPNHTYTAWATQPSPVSLSLPGSETATLDVDGTGRMWIGYDGPTTANVLWADAPYTTFSGPIVLASGILDDDIDVVTKVPGGMTVMWSDQATQRFGFRMHVDGADPTTWSANEIPGNQDALNVFHGMADDHINTAVASDGTFYAAVKTSYDTTGYPVLGLLVRHPNGVWDHFYPIDYLGTRPIVLLNEQAGLLTVAYTQSTNLDNILVKSTPTNAINFSGAAATLIKGKNNNVTSTRQNWTGSVMLMASDGTTTVPVTYTAPGTPSAPAASNGASQVTAGSSVSGTLAGTPGSGSDPMTYQIVTGPSMGTLNLTDPTTGAFTYTPTPGQYGTDSFTYQTVQGTLTSNIATWTVTISPAGGLVGQWNFDEGAGTTAADSSGLGNNAALVGTPTWVTGVHGTAIKLNGTTDWATIPDAPTLDATTALTISAWVKPTTVATQYLVKKAVSGTTDGYELGLSSAGKAFVRLNQASKGDTYRVDSVTSYPSSATWIHLAATYDGSTIRLYVNGVLEGSGAGPAALKTHSLARALGAAPGGTRPFRGRLDGGRVYTAALTQAQITALAAPPASAPTASGGASQVAAGSSVSGTLTGAPGSGSAPMTFQIVTNPTMGTLNLTNASTGAFTYTANPGQVGTDTFTYQTVQGTLTSNGATWTVTISPAGGLVGQWNFDEGSGTTAADSSGLGNNATLAGAPTWVTGVHGTAIKLNGTTDWATIPDAASLDATTALTISAWVKPTKVATQYLVKKAVSSTTDGYELGLSSAGKAFVRLNQASKADTYRVDSLTSYPTNGTWIHLAATYDGTTIRLYVNGVLEGSVAGPTSIKTNNLALTLGAEPGGFRPFAGTLDDVRVYSTALTQAQITTLATP